MEHQIPERYFRDPSMFIERSCYELILWKLVTAELEKNPTTIIPHVAQPSIEMQTSRHKAPLTPARIVPLTPIMQQQTQPVPRPQLAEIPVPMNPTPAVFRDISTTRKFVGKWSYVAGMAACRMRIRLPSSTATLCVVKTATLRELAAYIQQTQPGLEGSEIDILTGNPPVSIMTNVFVFTEVEL